MKTQVTLTVDSDIKDEFKRLASKMGANMSTLVNMYFTQVVNTWKIDFIYQEKFPENKYNNFIEINELSKEEDKELKNLPNFNWFLAATSWK